MAKQTKQPKTTRRHHSSEYRAEALGLADRVGVADAAKQLGLHDSQIYSWRAQARQRQDRGAAEHQLAIENVRLKRQLAEQTEELAILKKAAAYFAKHQKDPVVPAFTRGRYLPFGSGQSVLFR